VSESGHEAEPLLCASCARRFPLGERFCDSCGMPLTYAGAKTIDSGGERRDRARKIDPSFTSGELVRVAGGRHQAEAEMIQVMLLEEGVPSILRRSPGFDVPDFLAAGPRDVLVPMAGAEAARDLLLETDMAPQQRAPDSDPGSEAGHAARLLAVIFGGAALAALVAWALVQLPS
jgi:hypothetical protein